MNERDLVSALRPLETALHRAETRQAPDALARLLHPDFEEIGRSGRRYSLDDIFEEFRNAATFPEVVSTSYIARWLAEDMALLTYHSAHVDQEGRLHRHTLRSSLWLRTADGWQLRFHQGTPSAVTNWPTP